MLYITHIGKNTITKLTRKLSQNSWNFVQVIHENARKDQDFSSRKKEGDDRMQNACMHRPKRMEYYGTD